MGKLCYGCINDMPKGWLKESNVNMHIYDFWRLMWRRVGSHPNYKDCIICNDWKYLSNFFDWITKEDLYKIFSEHPYGYCIDKDMKKPGNKIYSPEYCTLTTISNNSKEMIERCGSPNKGKYKSIIRLQTTPLLAKVYNSVNDAKLDGYSVQYPLKHKTPSKGYYWYYLTIIQL